MSELSGVLCVHKEAGMTSHDVVNRVRKLYQTKQVGHTGTLDPMATGVLVLLVGRAVKASSFLTVHNKSYRVGLTLGLTTDTQDTTGEVLSVHEGPPPEPAAVMETCRQFVGTIEQMPPMFSALKVGGKKLVDLARQHIEIERTARPVTIESIEVQPGAGENEYVLEVACGPGTYMRTLCHDIGAALGCGGAMSALARLSVGAFTLADAHTLGEIEAMDMTERGQKLVPLETLFADCPAVQLPAFYERLARCGAEVYQAKIHTGWDEGTRVRLCGENGFFALGEVRAFEGGSAIKPIKQFVLEEAAQ
ncbi:MAG: tRNA pseudouridine(55) synthase TruB [Clostridiales bacterium]|nr:tRNA pseudouridine(55) synthase TruB [Clostridiales bacterium]